MSKEEVVGWDWRPELGFCGSALEMGNAGGVPPWSREEDAETEVEAEVAGEYECLLTRF